MTQPRSWESPRLPKVVATTSLAMETLASVRAEAAIPIEISRFHGQWLGRYGGTSSGTLLVNLDDMGTYFQGRAYAYDDNPDVHSVSIPIKTANRETSFHLRAQLTIIDTNSGEPQNNKYPSVRALCPSSAEVDFNLTDQIIKVTWKTDTNTFGSAEISRSRPDAPSEYRPLPAVVSWEQYKVYSGLLEHGRYVFRGQDTPSRLRTSFHRTGRADLERFLAEDIKTLHRHLSLRTSHIFDLDKCDEHGAFLNLVQHHGYPTPLLDWTFSPFVAAFFAYHRIKNSEARAVDDSKKARIFVFDQKEWCKNYSQTLKLSSGRPHFSVREFIAIDNERMIPQQSVSTVTNVDDIESYVRSTEMEGQRFLEIVDLPQRERANVMNELRLMGITAGSLFPGMDGACEELRERFFQL